MSVFVDDMRAPLGRMKMCHMIADTESELHDMAIQIGIARKWYQGDHYDICLSKRRQAVAAGAIEISRMDLGRKVVAERKCRSLRMHHNGQECTC